MDPKITSPRVLNCDEFITIAQRKTLKEVAIGTEGFYLLLLVLIFCNVYKFLYRQGRYKTFALLWFYIVATTVVIFKMVEQGLIPWAYYFPVPMIWFFSVSPFMFVCLDYTMIQMFIELSLHVKKHKVLAGDFTLLSQQEYRNKVKWIDNSLCLSKVIYIIVSMGTLAAIITATAINLSHTKEECFETTIGNLSAYSPYLFSSLTVVFIFICAVLFT